MAKTREPTGTSMAMIAAIRKEMNVLRWSHERVHVKRAIKTMLLTNPSLRIQGGNRSEKTDRYTYYRRKCV